MLFTFSYLAATAKSCNPPPKVENSIIKASYQREYFSDSEVTYQCRDNYMMEGQGKMICKDGQWMENIITCTRTYTKLYTKSHKGSSRTILDDIKIHTT